MTPWTVSVAAGLAGVIASRILARSGERRGARYVVAFAIGILIVATPIAAVAEVRYRRCIDGGWEYSHCNWLRGNPWGSTSPSAERTLVKPIRVKPIRIKPIRVKPIKVR